MYKVIRLLLSRALSAFETASLFKYARGCRGLEDNLYHKDRKYILLTLFCFTFYRVKCFKTSSSELYNSYVHIHNY